MPIRFSCEHCGQRLSVSSRKAGARAKCPKCKEPVTVPDQDSPTEETPPEFDDDQSPSGSSPYSEFIVYDDEVEWVYESDDDRQPAPSIGVTDLNRVAVPRSVLYAQGILLVVVAVVAFVFGIMIGSSSQPEVANLAPQPCVLTGQVDYVAGSGQNRPDDGAIVLVVPTDNRPDSTNKAAIEGLRPGDPLPQDDSENLRIIQSIGGGYTRVDANGRFQVQLPDHRRYFILVVSSQTYRAGGDEIDRGDLAQLGNYVTGATELLSNSKYNWRELTMRKDEAISVTF